MIDNRQADADEIEIIQEMIDYAAYQLKELTLADLCNHREMVRNIYFNMELERHSSKSC